MDNIDCNPALLNNILEYSSSLYSNSNTLLNLISNSECLGDFINFYNAKSSPSPSSNITASLYTTLLNLPNLPAPIGYYWVKKVRSQVDKIQSDLSLLLGIIKQNIPELSDTIGYAFNTYSMYTDSTTPYYSYLSTTIRPNFYLTGNTFHKINKYTFANIQMTSRYVDTLFKHNLAPTPEEATNPDLPKPNLIQSINVAKTEYINPYDGDAKSKTAHGENLVTDVNMTATGETIKILVKKHIKLIFSTLYSIINFLKSRSLQQPRSIENNSIEIATKIDIDSNKVIFEKFDILQQKIQDFDDIKTIESILK